MPTNYPVSVTVGTNYAQNIVVGDTVTLTVSATWTTSSAASGCTASAASGNASSVFTLTNFLLASASYSITITTTDKSGTYYSTISGTITEALPATPTDITFSAFGTENSPNASVTATTIGTPDVTLKIGQSINGATVTAYANSPATFYQVRGSTDTYRYWAYNYRTSTVRSNFYNELNTAATYLPSDTGTASSVTITSSATSATIQISGIDSAGVQTQIRLGTTTVLGTASHNTNIIITSNLPSAGAFTTYNFYTRRPVSNGGANDTWGASGTFTITRESAATGPSPPTTIALASTTQTASPIDVSVTASGQTAGSVAYVGATANGQFFPNGTAGFTATRGTAKTFYTYSRLNSINSSTVGRSATLAFVAQGLGDYTVGTTVVTTIANTSSAITGTLTGMGTNTQYQILKDTTWIETVNGFGNGSFTIETNELPTTGNSQTYVIKGRVPATYGGTTALYPPALWTNTTHSFTITNGTATDTTPDQFSFTDVTGVATGSEPTSSITVAGIDAAAAVTISGGTYSKNGGSYTSASTTAVLNDTFEVKHTASSFNNTSVNTTLTIGGVSDTFTSTTIAATTDTTPDAFSFSLSFLGTPANLSTIYVYSDLITVTGINAAADISISTGATGGGGEYSINNGSYTSTATTAGVVAGDRVRVRLHPAGTTGTTRSTTLEIGGVSATFTTATTGYTGTGLTAQAPTGITRTYMSDGEEPFRIIRATVTVGLNSFPIIRDTSGTDSGASNTFKSNSYEFYVPRGYTPTFNAYAYGYNNAAPATFSVTHGVVPYLAPAVTGSLTSATIAYDASTAYTFSYISPAGHDFRIGTSNVANPSATVNSDAVTLANSTPGATYNYYIETRRTVAKGGDALTWSTPHGLGTITRGGENSTPDAFSFVDPVATNIARTSTITSAPVTLTGMDIASTVTQLSAGFTATANGSAVTENAAVPANATLTLSTTSSGSYATPVSGSIAVGGVSSGTWTVTTQADPGTGTGGGGVSTGDYGLEIRNALGTTVFSPSMRTTNFIASGTYQGLGAGATSTAITSEGMTSAGEIAVLIDCPGQSTFVPDFTVTRYNGSFTIKNNSSASVDVNWMTVRY